MRAVVSILLALWFGLVVALGLNGAFTRPPGEPPLTILIGVSVPVAVFLLAYAALPGFQTFVRHIDLSLATAVQSWRFAGFGFLALYRYNVLPGSFAWPAGLGDIAIGLTAPWVARALVRRPEFAASRTFVIWNLLGILDLIVAVGSGGANSFFATGVPGEVTTRPMSELPLVLIPAFAVPLFIMLHLAALIQSRATVAADGHVDSRRATAMAHV
jgi:hypothetical protein